VPRLWGASTLFGDYFFNAMSKMGRTIFPEDVQIESALVQFPGDTALTLYRAVGKTKMYLTEEGARKEESTHHRCSCGNPTQRYWTLCDSCRRAKESEKYNQLPYQDWDEKGMVCIYGGDDFFGSIDDFAIWCEEHDIEDSTTVPLIICTPNMPREIGLDRWMDDLPEDVEPEQMFSSEFLEKLSELNKIIASHEPISYQSTGKYRTTINVNEQLNG
jgi:hypothetical protein